MYYIAVDGVGGASGTAQLNYNLGVTPVITEQPITQTVTAGGSVTLSVTASGVPAPLYQWYFGSNPIPGATNTSLTVAGFQSANQGNYKVVTSNFADSTASTPATLLLDYPLRLDSFTISSDACSMRLIGRRGGSYIIQCSIDLVLWSTLATNTVPYGIWGFVDTNINHFSSCYYRAVSQ